MSLGKLLTTGKSLVGLHDTHSRYQLRKGALPKFESSKNPFAARPPGESSTPDAPEEAQLPKLTPDEVAAANLKETPLPPIVNGAFETAAPDSKPVAAVKAPGVVDGWLKKLNPMVWWGNRKPAETKPAVPRFGKTPVQGELSLDNIKVMRNDLTEADVEVAPMKTRRPNVPNVPPAATQASAAAMAVPELPPATSAWEYLGERLMGKH
jgi:hypothetical protein